MKELDRAVALLHREGYTCVLCDKDRVMTSRKTGIAPLLEYLSNGESLKGAAAADRIIGKAAAMLLLSAGVTAVYGEVMSETALALLQEGGVSVRYDTLTPMIRNRTNTGPCPMEQAVAELTDPAQALPALQLAQARLRHAGKA